MSMCSWYWLARPNHMFNFIVITTIIFINTSQQGTWHHMTPPIVPCTWYVPKPSSSTSTGFVTATVHPTIQQESSQTGWSLPVLILWTSHVFHEMLSNSSWKLFYCSEDSGKLQIWSHTLWRKFFKTSEDRASWTVVKNLVVLVIHGCSPCGENVSRLGVLDFPSNACSRPLESSSMFLSQISRVRREHWNGTDRYIGAVGAFGGIRICAGAEKSMLIPWLSGIAR